MTGVMVVKRDGRKEQFDFNKILKMYNFCKQGLDIDDDKFWKNFDIK